MIDDPWIPKRRYSIKRPYRMVKTSCEKVRCPAWLRGWKSKIDETSSEGKIMADYIRHTRKGQFKEYNQDGFTVFDFPAQKYACFEAETHNRAEVIEEEATFTVYKEGDRTVKTHDSALHWVEDMGAHQNKLYKAAN